MWKMILLPRTFFFLRVFASDETGREEVCVTSFPERVQTVMISNQGGNRPLWSDSSAELFYFSGPNIMKVDLRPGENLSAGVPQVLINNRGAIGMWSPITGFSYDGEGERFLFARVDAEAIAEQNREARITHLNLVTNWFSELNRLAPTDE